LHFGGRNESLAHPKVFAAFLRSLFRKDWVVYAKAAFGGPAQVLRYLGHYTHRVAISNHRLLAFDGERVTFRWKDYAHGNKHKQRLMTLSPEEFLRRYVQHVLPHGFVRIRQFGFLANSQRAFALTLVRGLLGESVSPADSAALATGASVTWRCPRCGKPMRIGPRLSTLQLRWQWLPLNTS
jgi:hypothetical protein